MKKRNKDFDRNIREKLENLTPGFNADSWDKLQDRLDSEDAGSEWDAQFSHRLRQIERPYNRASWQALAERLDLEEKRLNSVYSAKAKELLFMALLLWSVTQLVPLPSTGPAIVQTQLHPAPAEMHTQQPVAANAEIATTAPSSIATTQQTTSSAIATKQKNTSSGVAAANTLIPSFATTPLLSGQTETAIPVMQEALILSLPAMSVDMLTPIQAGGYEAVAPISDLATASELPASEIRVEMPAFAMADVNPQLLPEHEWALEKGLSPQPLPRKRFVRIGMMGASDYNRIITPPVRVNTDILSLDQYALGYSGGITIGFEKDRWEVETGFIYTAKRYYPLQVVYVEGSLKDGIFGSGIKQTEFDIMQVPLNFRYNFFTYDRWRIYGMIGASLHIVAQSNYYIADLEDYETLASPRPQPGRDGQERPELLESQVLDRGWLEGGNLLDNSYLGVSAGAGLERYMSPRWSLFAQPTYYHSVFYPNKGLGPVNDRIHTMSLFMGVKVRM